MDIRGKQVVVTGGSRGLGLGLVEALVDNGALVTAVARGEADLRSAQKRLGISFATADVTDPAAASQILRDVNPDVVVLNAGTPPRMGRIDQIGWEDFSATWEVDVKGALAWTQAALRQPLAPGSRVLMTSSGAAINGSPLSGGYGGAKKMIWLIAQYANAFSLKSGLKIRFQVVVPQQMVGGTGTGDAGSRAYADADGITPQKFLEKFGPPMPPRMFGNYIVDILEDARHDRGLAFGLRAATGVSILDAPPARE